MILDGERNFHRMWNVKKMKVVDLKKHFTCKKIKEEWID